MTFINLFIVLTDHKLRFFFTKIIIKINKIYYYYYYFSVQLDNNSSIGFFKIIFAYCSFLFLKDFYLVLAIKYSI